MAVSAVVRNIVKLPMLNFYFKYSYSEEEFLSAINTPFSTPKHKYTGTF